ncbi:MFS transporter [Embleya scabrispora]|uniref:MFS transporter n=1 Tax=Embleya scabrispora TaxID=159449 RepID=UPI000D0F958B|nr:MFS transporter [Embleya scabrispora]MYS83552.1 MFS transporter [Streptomyces sp. SID5474]
MSNPVVDTASTASSTPDSGPAGAPGSAPEIAGARSWLAVTAIAVGTFAVVCTEMLPVGLLTPISHGLHVSDGSTGLAITLAAVVAGFAAPIVLVAAGRVDRRIVLAAMMFVLLAANTISALAPNFATLLVARVLVGTSIGGFWAIGASLPVRLVPARSVGRAAAVIFGGVSVASVVGVPIGTMIGEWAGWRVAFAVMAGLSAAVLITLLLLLPPLPAERAVRPRELTALLRRRTVLTGATGLILLVAGHFGAYTYVRPILEEVGDLGPGPIGGLLLGYGVAGVVGNFVAGAYTGRAPHGTLAVAAGLLACSVAVLALSGSRTPGTVTAMLAWGLAYGAVPVGLQGWLLRSAPDAPEAASAVFVTGFQLAIALGSLLGGAAVDAVATSAVLWCGGVLAAATTLPALAAARRERGRASTARG